MGTDQNSVRGFGGKGWRHWSKGWEHGGSGWLVAIAIYPGLIEVHNVYNRDSRFISDPIVSPWA